MNGPTKCASPRQPPTAIRLRNDFLTSEKTAIDVIFETLKRKSQAPPDKQIQFDVIDGASFDRSTCGRFLLTLEAKCLHWIGPWVPAPALVPAAASLFSTLPVAFFASKPPIPVGRCFLFRLPSLQSGKNKMYFQKPIEHDLKLL